MFFLTLLLQCKFANSTLLSLLSFSNFITPYDAQASSAFSALISTVPDHHLCPGKFAYKRGTMVSYFPDAKLMFTVPEGSVYTNFSPSSALTETGVSPI